MNSLRKRLLLALVLVVSLLLPLTALADPLVPDRPASAPAYRPMVPLWDDPRFPPWAYTLEGDGQSNSVGYVTLYFWMNQVMVGKAWLLKVALRTVEYALTSDFVLPFLEPAGEATTALGSLLWEWQGGPLVVGALSLTGLWAILLYMRGKASRAWAALGASLLVVMGTAMVLASGKEAARSATDVARQMSLQVYAAVEGLGQTSGAPGTMVARSGDAAWRALIYEPWRTAEFGSAAGEQTYGQTDNNGFLARTVSGRYTICSNYQQKLVSCPWWDEEFMPRRMTLALYTGLVTLVYAGALLVLAGSMILAQLVLLLLLVLAPVAMLVALWWPGRSVHLLSGYCMRLLGALVSQTLLAATLAVLLYLTGTVESVFPMSGWMFRSLLVAGLAGVAVRYRYAWLKPLTFFAPVEPREGESSMRAWVRSHLSVRRREQVSLATVSEPVREVVPVFAAMQAAVGQQPPEQRAVTPDLPVIGFESDPKTPPQRPQEVFHQQMETLRERFYQQEAPGRRTAAPPPGKELEPPQAARSGRPKAEFPRLPPERPKQ